MASDRSLMYSIDIFNGCYKIIENFLARAYYYCLCDLYQGCYWRTGCS